MSLHDKEWFEITEQHLTLLRNARVGWDGCEFGAPAIDCKRPYGNGDVYADMMQLLSIEPIAVRTGFADWSRSEVQEAELRKLHEGTQTALQIILAVGYFKAGRYECEKYGRNWRKVAK